MREILSKESYQRQQDLRNILSVFSGELSRGESRKTLIDDGAALFGDIDVRSISNGEVILLCAGILKRTVTRLSNNRR